jgi:hypothetical protein
MKVTSNDYINITKGHGAVVLALLLSPNVA